MSVHSKSERLIYRLLFLDPPVQAEETTSDTRAERAFGFSLIFSGVRCVLQYVVLPFVLPVVGLAADAATPVILLVNAVALVSILYSVRRFWQIDYKYKWQYLPVAGVALLILCAFIILDLSTLLGG